MGVSVISDLAVKSDIESGILKTVRINGVDAIRREFYMVINKRFTLSPVADAFLEILGALAELMPSSSMRNSTIKLA